MVGNASEINMSSSKITMPDEFSFKASSTNDLSSKFSPEIRAIVLEYAKLSSQDVLSESEADRLGDILTVAADNEELNFWLTEVDHVLGHAMGFLTDKARQSYEDQQALLREHHGAYISCPPVSDELKQRNGKITSIHGEYSLIEP